MTASNQFFHRMSFGGTMLLAGVLAGSIVVSPLMGQTAAPAAPPDQKIASQGQAAVNPSSAGETGRYHQNRMPARAAAYFQGYWGIDSLTVKAVESGELIRFSYRVVDGDRAQAINNKSNEAFLESGRVRLSVPSLEKVGQLRQSSTPIAGMSYWMAFSNPGRPVKKGDRVNIVIGQFRADGLLVE